MNWFYVHIQNVYDTFIAHNIKKIKLYETISSNYYFIIHYYFIHFHFVSWFLGS
jgi:hypothetical protein